MYTPAQPSFRPDPNPLRLMLELVGTALMLAGVAAWIA